MNGIKYWYSTGITPFNPSAPINDINPAMNTIIFVNLLLFLYDSMLIPPYIIVFFYGMPWGGFEPPIIKYQLF